ncbi:hypothetical protein V6N13_133000 [Hibiscus sabdariffa]|uniref:Uncharacterized protein n=1 Tax=Hibiscus sabdariffa TaxID=183260 RepID=A0ABR2PWY4_9ROSI
MVQLQAWSGQAGIKPARDPTTCDEPTSHNLKAPTRVTSLHYQARQSNSLLTLYLNKTFWYNLSVETNLITNKKKNCSTSITIAPSDLAEQPELFPTNSPELGMGAKASESGHCGGASVGKNEDIPGAFTRGKTAGEAEIAGSLATVCKLDKKMTNGTTAANNLELVVDMDEV